eukprot:COSAG03_NODE_17780_length_368_cov_0.840149_1_plen_81_part_01
MYQVLVKSQWHFGTADLLYSRTRTSTRLLSLSDCHSDRQQCPGCDPFFSLSLSLSLSLSASYRELQGGRHSCLIAAATSAG